MKSSQPAGDRGVPWWAALLWVPSVAVLLVSVVGILSGVRLLTARQFDDLHWTVTHLAAAGLAWIGVRMASAADLRPRRWFALGLSAIAAGHIFWNVQQFVKWNPFPALSDLLFLSAGPACAMGFWSCLRGRVSGSRLRLAGIDAAALSAALIALMLALYLPRRGEMSVWPLAVLAAYPAAFFSAACAGVILVLTLRLRMQWGSVVFLLGLIGSGTAWMQSNLLKLDHAYHFGGWLSLLFSASTVALGVGAMAWRAEGSSNPAWEHFCEWVLRLMPMVLVISAAMSLVLVWTLPGVSRAVQTSIEFGAAGVVALAMARQSAMLADRNRMLAAEHRLRESEGKFRTLFEMAEDAVFILDGPVFVDCNRSTLRLFGCTRKEIIGVSPVDLSPEFQPDGQRSEDTAVRIIAAAMGGTPQALEWRMIRKSDGMWFDAEVHVNRIEMEGRALLGAIVRDITGRKRAEEQERLSTERLRLALSAGKVGFWDRDLASGKLLWDEQMYLMYGMSSSTAEEDQNRWARCVHPDDIPQLKAIQEEALRGKERSFESNFRIHRESDGSLRYIRALGTYLRDTEGRPSRVLGINWDITEERLREEQLSRALEREKEFSREARAGELAKSEFLAVMSHEIRTPMNGILGFAELLGQTQSLPADCRDYVQTITTSSEALLRILDDILAFSRLEAGRVEIEKSAFAVRDMLEDIHTLLSPSSRNKELAFELETDSGIPDRIIGDAGRLRQVLLNLVGNAIKFTKHGSVTLGMRRPPGSGNSRRIEFHVRDTGEGIPSEKLAAIFHPFVQADSTISRRHGGAGLGLTISRRLTELMGGELHVESEPGKGSLFSVVVPVDFVPGEKNPEAGPADAGEPLDANFAAGHPLKILFVEDDNVNLRLIGIVLRRLGYEPLTARNGREAVEIFRSHRPDFVLMDIQMPEMDGIEATRQIREIERAAPERPVFIVAHTANIAPAERQRCFDSGMDHYLNKPLRPSLLAQALKMAEARPRPEDQPETGAQRS